MKAFNPWIIFAVLTAFFESAKDVFSKKGLEDIDEYVVAWALRFFALPFLLPLLFFIDVHIGEKFWFALLIGGSMNIFTTILYMKAIKYSDLSITVPMVAFTPMFLLITSPLIVGEFPSFMGLIGILLIVTGSYVLNIKEMNRGYVLPIKALLKEKGPKLMLFVAFLWSITSNIDKIGVLNSSPIFWVISVNVFVAMLLFPVMLLRSKNIQISKNLKALMPIGLCSALTLIFQMTAISLTLVVYVISIKRTSTLLSVLWGFLIFNEKGIKERMLGTGIMMLGVIFITLFHA